MTKLYASALTLLAAALIPVAGMAQKYNLVSLVSGIGEEEFEYEYDRQGHLVSEHFNYEWDYSGTNLFYYNPAGNIIKMEWYQDMTNALGEIYERYTARIEYKYNDKEQMISQHVYNNFAPGEDEADFDYNAMIEYEYDALGRLYKSTTYFMEEGKELNGDLTYYYNGETEVLDSMVSRVYLPDFKIMVCDSRVDFAYDAEGRLHEKSCTSYDPENGKIAEWYGLIYDYDKEGNLDTHYRIGSNGQKAYQFGFTYNNSISAADCNFPIYPYDAEVGEIYQLMIHQPETKISYLQGASGGLVRYDVSDFTFEEVGSGAITDVVVPTRSLLVMGCKDGKLVLNGVANGETLRIVDMKGRTVATPTYFGSADLSALPRGTYLVKGNGGTGKFIR